MQSNTEFLKVLEDCGADLLKLKRLSDQLRGLEGDWCGRARMQVIDVMRRARTSLPPSDGRPLYQYHLQKEQFEYWQETLRAQVASGRKPHAGAFVLWAAEWFRRCYQGDRPKWELLGEPLDLQLSQSDWRHLADTGLRYWGLRSVRINGFNYRLVAIARQAGFPIAALAEGQGGWAERYLTGLVGQLLGAAVIREDTALRIADNLSAGIPDTWRNDEMQAVCADLATVIVSLRKEADAAGAGNSALVSIWLSQNRPEWRDELPLRMEGQASVLIDKLLTTKAVPNAGGNIRVRRFVDVCAGEVQEGLALDLNGELKLGPKLRAALDREGGIVRLRMFAAGEFAQSISGELATLDVPKRPDAGWGSRLTHRKAEHRYPFAKSVGVELRADGQRVDHPFEIRGGEPVSGNLRIYEPDEQCGEDRGRLWLRGWGSGAFRAHTLIVEVPKDWTVNSQLSSDHEGNIAWFHAGDRTFWKITDRFEIENPQGDRYLIRPGQSVARRDGLNLFGKFYDRVVEPSGTTVIVGRPTVQLAEAEQPIPTGSHLVGWRRQGERNWQALEALPSSGNLEFGWRDGSTGHLRAKSSAIVLPQDFALSFQKNGDFLTIELSGWDGKAELARSHASGDNKWRVNLATVDRDRLDLVLTDGHAKPILLLVPLPIMSWIANWDGELVPRNSVLSLATLNRYVARNDRYDLMATVVKGGTGGYSEVGRIWRGSTDTGLSSLRDDIARMIRPLGIRAEIQLDFNDSYSNHWYIREFETELEERHGRGWFPQSSCGEDLLFVRGRRMAEAAREVTFGQYDLSDAIAGNPLPIPRLNEPWLVYLAADDRILSLPRVIGQTSINPQAATRLGKAMSFSNDKDETKAALNAFVTDILDAPSSPDSVNDIRTLISLAHSLRDLPPKTFHVFDILTEMPQLGPHMLMHSGESELGSVLGLADGLPFDWSTIPVESWQQAHRSAGSYYMQHLPEMAGQTASDRGLMIVNLLEQQKASVLAELPWLAGAFSQTPIEQSYDIICEQLFDRSGDRIDRDRSNPFRPDMDPYLSNRGLSSGLARVCDAPVAAALAAAGKLRLMQNQIMAVKDVREHHPQYFGEAYGFALGELV